MKIDWQPISTDETYGCQEATERLAVPGGWLYRSRIRPNSNYDPAPVSVAMVFVPVDGVKATNRDRDEWGMASGEAQPWNADKR